MKEINWENLRNCGLRVRRDMVGRYLVSTIYLGIDHQWDNGPPLWYETMVFDGDEDVDMDRYTTREEAVAGHHIMVEKWRNK